MTGEIELEGRKGKHRWKVTFDMFNFLEAMLETVDVLNNELGDPPLPHGLTD